MLKPGTLENNSAIAGFYLPKSGKKYAFAIMISNHNLAYEVVKGLEDELLMQILKGAG